MFIYGKEHNNLKNDISTRCIRYGGSGLVDCAVRIQDATSKLGPAYIPDSDKPFAGSIPISSANIQVEINNKSDLISKLNNSGYDLTKTHNIYEI